MPLKLQHDEQTQLNLTPMIDVLFLLIMFFMVATKFGDMERNIELKVPQVAKAGDSVSAPKALGINVFADGRLELDGRIVTMEELTVRLTDAVKQWGNPSVVIRGDAQCAFQQVASALGACRAANISELGITVRVASAASPPAR